MINDIRKIVFLNSLCDKLGIDTIYSGNLAAFAIEASKQKKFLTTWIMVLLIMWLIFFMKLFAVREFVKSLQRELNLQVKNLAWRILSSMSKVWTLRGMIQESSRAWDWPMQILQKFLYME